MREVLAAIVGSWALGFGSAAGAQAFQSEIATWVAQDALDPPPANALLVVGSSSIRLWEKAAATFARYDVIQRGFGGSQFSDLNGYVDDIVLPYDPAAIVVFEGSNDVAAGKSAATVFADYLTFVNLVHAGQSQSRPPIPILFIAITPTPARWSQWPIASDVNAMVQAHASTDPSLGYMDTTNAFLATGSPPSAALFQSDGLHLNQNGYDIWAAILGPIVESAVPPTKRYAPATNRVAPGERILFDFGPSDQVNGNPTASPDAFGQHWNNWHNVGGGVPILAGEHLGGIVTASGASTDVRLIITGQFHSNGILNGGLLAPSTALLGSLALPTATQDYFFAPNTFTFAGVLLTGLEPLGTYDLAFFATRAATETRITRYLVDGRNDTTIGDLQTSGLGIGSNAHANGNDDEILRFPRVRPDAFGRLFVDIELVAGTFAYLGALELTARRGNVVQRGQVRPGNEVVAPF